MSFFKQTNTKTVSQEYLDEFNSSLSMSNTHFDILKKHSKINQAVHLNDMLINVHNNYELFKSIDTLKSGISDDSCLFVKNKSDSKQFSIVNREQFEERFNKLTNNLLNFFDWNNVVVAGGVVSLALSDKPIDECLQDNYDIDMFVYGVRESEAKKIITRIYDSIKDIVPESKCIKTNKTITVALSTPYRHIQFVTTLFESAGDILHNFDICSSKVMYDGNNVFTTPDGHFGLVNNVNIFSEKCMTSAYVGRLCKYAKRKYKVFVPELVKSNISQHVYKKTTKELENNTLLKLLHADKFGKGYSDVSDETSYLMNNTNYVNNNSATSYNTVFFGKHKTMDSILTNLQKSSDNVLYSLKLRNINEPGRGPTKKFKPHDLEKFPVYKVFDNIKLALIDENI